MDRTDIEVFISHASEDKERFVRALADLMQSAGVRVWYDEFSLRIGDSLRASIDRGLARCRYAIIVLSPAFCSKAWTNGSSMDCFNGTSTRVTCCCLFGSTLMQHRFDVYRHRWQT